MDGGGFSEGGGGGGRGGSVDVASDVRALEDDAGGRVNDKSGYFASS
jgi:hypothetical protein